MSSERTENRDEGSFQSGGQCHLMPWTCSTCACLLVPQVHLRQRGEPGAGRSAPCPTRCWGSKGTALQWCPPLSSPAPAPAWQGQLQRWGNTGAHTSSLPSLLGVQLIHCPQEPHSRTQDSMFGSSCLMGHGSDRHTCPSGLWLQ